MAEGKCEQNGGRRTIKNEHLDDVFLFNDGANGEVCRRCLPGARRSWREWDSSLERSSDGADAPMAEFPSKQKFRTLAVHFEHLDDVFLVKFGG